MKRVVVNFGMQNDLSHDLASQLLDYVERFDLSRFVRIVGKKGECIDVDGRNVHSFEEMISIVEESL